MRIEIHYLEHYYDYHWPSGFNQKVNAYKVVINGVSYYTHGSFRIKRKLKLSNIMIPLIIQNAVTESSDKNLEEFLKTLDFKFLQVVNIRRLLSEVPINGQATLLNCISIVNNNNKKEKQKNDSA